MSGYKDSDGKTVSLYQLINKEPGWAVNIIEKLKEENKALKEKLRPLSTFLFFGLHVLTG